MTWINQSDLLLKSVRDSNKNLIAHRLTFSEEQFCLVCRWLSFMLLPSPTSWWRFLPSSGWQCTGYWWCCWTSPVPLGDSSCETGDCCSRGREKTTCYHSLSNVYHLFYVCCSVSFPTAVSTRNISCLCEFTVIYCCQMESWPKYNSLCVTVLHFKFEVSDLFLYISPFFP